MVPLTNDDAGMEVNKQVGETPLSAIDMLGSQVEAHEVLRVEHERLRLSHEESIRSVDDLKARLEAASQEQARSDRTNASLRATVERHVQAAALQAAYKDAAAGTTAHSSGAAAAEQAHRLEKELAIKEAELCCTRSQVEALDASRMKVVELEAQVESERRAARLAEHRARLAEDHVREHVKKAGAMREAFGRSEMEHQRRGSERDSNRLPLPRPQDHPPSLSHLHAAKIGCILPSSQLRSSIRNLARWPRNYDTRRASTSNCSKCANTPLVHP